MSTLVTNLQDRRTEFPSRFENLLVILDLKSGVTEVIEHGPDAFITPQCWSPDEKHIVYIVNKPVGIRASRLYDTVLKRLKDIANGGFPTWSPDGKWISYKSFPASLRGCTYHQNRTSTGEDTVLFCSDSGSALSWSPDSSFVAYSRMARIYELKPSVYRLAFDLVGGVERLRARRLEDGAEFSFADFGAGSMTWVQWVN